MPDMVISRIVQVEGKSFASKETLSYDTGVNSNPTLAVAKTGTLTTRTNDTVGTLTMASGHGITTAAKISIFWTNTDGTAGKRYNVTVGTVATNSVPFSSGSGDNLPLAATTITAMVEHTEVVSVVGDNVKALCATAPVASVIQLLEADDTPITAIWIGEANEAYQWTELDGSDNPLEGVTVGKIVTSHSDSNVARAPLCTLAYV